MNYKELVLEETEREAHECVLRLLDKVVEWQGTGYENVQNMLVEQMYDDIYTVEPGELYKMYRYLIRLMFHLNAGPDYSELNRLRLRDDESIEIYAYDYKTFCWCLDHNLTDGIGNGTIALDKDKTPQNVYKNLLKKMEAEE